MSTDFQVPKGGKVPEHWNKNSWEEKARENPLYAVMTTSDMVDADPQNFSEEHLVSFFEKGVRVFESHILPRIEETGLPASDVFVVEYGCGAGRILRAVVNAGYACGGIDISPTMLDHCRRLVPDVREVHCLDAQGRSAMADAVADVVFSFSVVQHIGALSAYRAAVGEMMRVLKAGGILALQVNCLDFEKGDIDNPDRTENHETYSLHFRSGEDKPYRKHEQSTWSGVHIGIETLRTMLAEGGVSIDRIYFHSPKKMKGVWVIGRKG